MTRPKTSANTSNFVLAIGTLASIIIVGGVLYQAQKDDLLDSEILSIPEQQVITLPEAPEVPEATIPSSNEIIDEEMEATEEKPTLPRLDESDQFVRDRISMMSSKEGLKTWLSTDDLLRRSASYLDGLSRGVILGKIFPLSSPERTFATHRDGDIIWLNAGNYERYNATIQVLTSIDMKLVAQMFHFSRPLLESAFSELGYQPRQMDGIILTALDQVISTPVIVEPIQLTRDSVIYKFADPGLESLTPLQKQLIRSGPENTQRLQQQAILLKNSLLDPNGGD
ncbi:MAG: hypothetical protein CMK24_07430 [Porticoccaceae bacterium]|nr:hypothetical protein [Porticoccaceae bacterium]|tara:strand:- start:2292 stop:3140 length:849 start_codon:yes stop_codon:yes gene_type:complete